MGRWSLARPPAWTPFGAPPPLAATGSVGGGGAGALGGPGSGGRGASGTGWSMGSSSKVVALGGGTTGGGGEVTGVAGWVDGRPSDPGGTSSGRAAASSPSWPGMPDQVSSALGTSTSAVTPPYHECRSCT